MIHWFISNELLIHFDFLSIYFEWILIQLFIYFIIFFKLN